MGPVPLIQRLAEVLEGAGVAYCVVGSVAAMHYGEPRSTLDIDVVVMLDDAGVRSLLAAFSGDEYYLSPEAVHEAVRHGTAFNILHPGSGFKIDVMCATQSAFDRERLRRARHGSALGVPMRVAAPEDVILKKLQYYREGGSDKHLRDVASMIKISGETFDRAYLEHWADELRVREEWDAIKARVGW